MSDASNLVLLHVPQSEAEVTAREMFQAGLNDDATRILQQPDAAIISQGRTCAWHAAVPERVARHHGARVLSLGL